MARNYSFTLDLLFNEELIDNAGNWQYAGANGVDKDIHVQLIATKRTNAFGQTSFPVSMLTATILFHAEPGEVPQNMTLQGVHDLVTNNETGSVSAASAQLADQIGGAFFFDFESKLLTIETP
jgi:hypothetical protein